MSRLLILKIGVVNSVNVVIPVVIAELQSPLDSSLLKPLSRQCLPATPRLLAPVPIGYGAGEHDVTFVSPRAIHVHVDDAVCTKEPV